MTRLEALDGAGAVVVVVYSANSIPFAVATSSSGRAVLQRMGGMPGMMIRVVEVGDESLAGHLARLMGELSSLPFGIIGPERPATSADGVADAPRRRGRKPGATSKGGRKGGRPARVATGEDGADAPKRRGWKPRIESTDTTGAMKRRGSGRPKKSGGNGEAEALRRLGRPKGSKYKPKVV